MKRLSEKMKEAKTRLKRMANSRLVMSAKGVNDSFLLSLCALIFYPRGEIKVAFLHWNLSLPYSPDTPLIAVTGKECLYQCINTHSSNASWRSSVRLLTSSCQKNSTGSEVRN